MIGTLLICASLLAVDCDTIKCNGVNLRDMGDGRPFVSGYDAPETRDPECSAERALGRVAKDRMSQLLRTPGLQIIDSGDRDRYDRPLVWALLSNGQSIGNVLISRGSSRWAPGSSHSWC